MNYLKIGIIAKVKRLKYKIFLLEKTLILNVGLGYRKK